jgi:hypothetical protein
MTAQRHCTPVSSPGATAKGATVGSCTSHVRIMPRWVMLQQRGDILLAHGVYARLPFVILTGTYETDVAMRSNKTTICLYRYRSNTWPALAG